MTHVLVLHARLTAGPGPAALAPLLARLPYAKRLDLEGRDPQLRHASLAGIALVLRGIEALRSGPAAAGRLQFPTGGKPCVPGGPSFNVSHAGERVAAALCVDSEVGFDLEEFDPATSEHCAAQARLARWTATEAVLKAAGRGLGDARAVVLGESLQHGRIGAASFHLRPVAIAEDVVAHLATGAPVTTITVEEVEASVLARCR